MVTITYGLTPAGQKHSLLRGGNGKDRQTRVVSSDDPHYAAVLEAATIFSDGTATLDLCRRRCELLPWGGTGRARVYDDVRSFDTGDPATADLLAAHHESLSRLRDAFRQRCNEVEPSDLVTYSPYINDDILKCPDIPPATLAAAQALLAERLEKSRLAEAARLEEARRRREVLREWAVINGSELTRLRLQEKMDSWELAAQDDIDAIGQRVVDALDVPAVWRKLTNRTEAGSVCSSNEPRKQPTLDELHALRTVRQQLPANATCQLRYITYGDGRFAASTDVKVSVVVDIGQGLTVTTQHYLTVAVFDRDDTADDDE